MSPNLRDEIASAIESCVEGDSAQMVAWVVAQRIAPQINALVLGHCEKCPRDHPHTTIGA